MNVLPKSDERDDAHSARAAGLRSVAEGDDEVVEDGGIATPSWCRSARTSTGTSEPSMSSLSTPPMKTDGRSRWAAQLAISRVPKLRATPLWVVSTTASGAVSATTLTMSSGSRLMPQSMTLGVERLEGRGEQELRELVDVGRGDDHLHPADRHVAAAAPELPSSSSRLTMVSRTRSVSSTGRRPRR